jgi:hypothetical protein
LDEEVIGFRAEVTVVDDERTERRRRTGVEIGDAILTGRIERS